MSDVPRHLLTVWNPSYAADAMDEHLRLLLYWTARWRQGDAPEDEVYVWWAKLRSPHRRDPLPHLAEITALQQQIECEVETHLYLTDYRSLYVAHLDEITADDVSEASPDEAGHIPAYYAGKLPELWFCLTDIRRLVADDTPAVIEELKHLHNVRYHGHPVSLYGGMVDLPLMVTRDREVAWFGEAELLDDSGRWAERAAELRGEVERLVRELRENLFGPCLWGVLETSTRNFVASAEAEYRTRRADPNFDFSGAAVQYAKAVETELNALIFPAVAQVVARGPAAERITHVEGRDLDLGSRVPHQTLGRLITMLAHDEALRRAVKIGLPPHWHWLLGTLPHQLEGVQALRNPAAHSDVCTRDHLRPVREAVLGIGCDGILAQIARARL